MAERRYVMGMPVSIDVREDTVAPLAVQAVFTWLAFVDETFSTYRADSDISRIGSGALAARDAHPLVREVLARCERVREQTDGYFDARAGGVLDPSGLVKGWAVQRAGELIEATGARDYCIDAGGDLCLRGGPEPGRPWRVGVRHPHERDRLAAVLELTDAAVATSGAYERGEHIVDPHTGRPPEDAVAVTVVGLDLGTADAYATAAFAMGEEGPAWTATLEGYAAMTILSGDRVLSTAGFVEYCAGASVADSLG